MGNFNCVFAMPGEIGHAQGSIEPNEITPSVGPNTRLVGFVSGMLLLGGFSAVCSLGAAND